MNKKGFTLIEVLVAIAIIGIISSFIVIQMNGATDATKDTKRKADIELISNAIILYRSENYSRAPIEDCIIGECTTLPDSLQPFLATLPTDPDSRNEYRYISSDGIDCSVYATLSDGSIYKYECADNQIATLLPISGVCGGDDGGIFDYGYIPVNLCNSGNPSSVAGEGPWFWSCEGENMGDTATCGASLSDVFTCSITSDSCGGVDVLHIYSLDGGHAELNTQSNYSQKVCCVGGGAIVTNITDSSQCEENQATILKLYSATNSHVEKGTENNYTNKVCLSAIGKTATCTYASSCPSGYVQLITISDGETSLHVSDSIFTNKVCCKLTSY